MRILWVYEALTPQHLRLADCISRLPGVQLDIMSRSVLPETLDRVGRYPIRCGSKIDLAARRSIRKRLLAEPYDVLHAYTSRNLANAIGALRGLARPPRVVGYRGIIDQPSRLDPANWLTFFHADLAGVTAVCNATRESLLAAGIPPHKVATVWEGCNPQLLQNEQPVSLEQFNVPAGATVVGTVATIRRVKGIDMLLRAAVELTPLDLYWVLIGPVEDSLVESLASDPKIRDKVRLPGRLENAGRYAQCFDVYVAPSRKEGLSMAIMEAMAQRAATVVTSVGGNPELIRHQTDGLVVPPESPSALANAIERLVTDVSLRHRYAASAHERVQSIFTVEQWATRLISAYEQFAVGRNIMRAA